MIYQIEQKVLEATLQYLAQQPYSEVQNLINALRSASPVEEEKPKKAKK